MSLAMHVWWSGNSPSLRVGPVEYPLRAGIDPLVVRMAETLGFVAQGIRDAIWQGREADQVEPAELALHTRAIWQDSTGLLMELFEVPDSISEELE